MSTGAALSFGLIRASRSGLVLYSYVLRSDVLSAKSERSLLISVSTQYGLQQLQRESTKLGSLLNLFFTNDIPLMSSIDTIPGVSTDTEHEALVAVLNHKVEITK